MNSGASGSSLRCSERLAIFLSRASSRSRAAGSSRPRTSSFDRAAWKARRPRSVRMITLVQPFMEPTLPTEMSAERPRKSAHSSQPFSAAPWKSLTGSSTASSPSRYSTIMRPADHVHLRDAVQVDAPLVAQLLQRQRLVVEVLRAHQRDGQHDRIHPVRAGRPAARLHGPEPLHLARRPHHGDARLGRQRVPRQVELGQRHRLVVEAPRGGPDLVGRRRDGGDALPLLVGVGARLRHEGAVDLSGREEPDQERARPHRRPARRPVARAARTA